MSSESVPECGTNTYPFDPVEWPVIPSQLPHPPVAAPARPRVERIYATPTADGGEGLLATVVRRDPAAPPGVTFPSDHSDQLQVGLLRHPQGYAVRAHRHPPRNRVVRHTEEVLVVLAGRVTLFLYDSAGNPEATRTLHPGDVAVLHAGGHALYVEEACEVVEVKQGPYLGAAADKAFLTPALPGPNAPGGDTNDSSDRQ